MRTRREVRPLTCGLFRNRAAKLQRTISSRRHATRATTAQSTATTAIFLLTDLPPMLLACALTIVMSAGRPKIEFDVEKMFWRTDHASHRHFWLWPLSPSTCSAVGPFLPPRPSTRPRRRSIGHSETAAPGSAGCRPRSGRRNLVHIRVTKYEAGPFDSDVVGADIVQAQEARIAALERLAGQLALENEFLKGLAEHVRRPERNGCR